jgi:hypothetical protein
MLVAEVIRTFTVAAKMFQQHARYPAWSGSQAFSTSTLTLLNCIKETVSGKFVSWYSIASAGRAAIAAEML